MFLSFVVNFNTIFGREPRSARAVDAVEKDVERLPETFFELLNLQGPLGRFWQDNSCDCDFCYLLFAHLNLWTLKAQGN